MDINWTAVSAIGTITSSLLGLIALLISLRNKKNEERKSKPLLYLYPAYVGSDYVYFIVRNLSHVNVKIAGCTIFYRNLLKSNKTSTFNRFLIKLSQIFNAGLIKVINSDAAWSIQQKYPDIFRFRIGDVYTDKNKCIDPDYYHKELPELLEPQGNIVAAVNKADILNLSNDMLIKAGNHQKMFKLGVTCSNGVVFLSKNFRLDKMK